MTARNRTDSAVEDLLARRRNCMHQQLDTSTPRERARGLRRGYCAICGQDMTEDTGD